MVRTVYLVLHVATGRLSAWRGEGYAGTAASSRQQGAGQLKWLILRLKIARERCLG